MSTFHFNRRDVSFRYNLSAINGQPATLMTSDRRLIPFTSATVEVDRVTVWNDEDWTTVRFKDIELVTVEVEDD